MTTDSPRIALITGAGRGIGRAIALRLGHAGFLVALAARTRSQQDRVARRKKGDGTWPSSRSL